MLEDRLALSTTSAISGNFNGTAIPAGNTVWFSSALTASGLGSAPVTLHVQNGSIDFTANGTAYHVSVPNAEIVFDPTATSATSSFDPGDSDWDTTVPSKGTGDVFMSGVALPLPNGLPGGIKAVTWKADFWTDTKGISVNWKWGAAAYGSFSTDPNAVGVKPVDAKNLSDYANSDQSGTPEAFKSAVIAGGTGGGDKNFTGNLTPAKSVKPTLGDGISDYPFVSSNPLTSVAFNESEVLRAGNLDAASGSFMIWYNDEHALALGVNQVTVKTAAGSTTTTYPLSPMTSNPSAVLNPAVGTTATTGNQAGTDPSGRPMAPSLYITDITTDPKSRAGDWQYGGTAYSPSAVFGSWKAFGRTVDTTTATPTVSLTTVTDPAKNGWNLGPGSDPAPAGLRDEGYGAEVRWNLNDLSSAGVLVPGHTYRFYVIVHDGDQNKVGGDCGQASFTYVYPGPSTPPGGHASISGSVFLDFNLDGIKEPEDFGIAGTEVTLTGTDAMGNSITLTTTTDDNGFYTFEGLVAGVYTISRPHPSGFFDAQSVVGTINGLSNGDASTGDIAMISLGNEDKGVDYDFTEFLPNS